MRVIDTEKLPIKMWITDIEDGALEQAKNIANLPFTFKHVAIMPDSHQGYGMPIGGVLATKNVVIPNAVGVDIGCGMIAVKTPLTELSTEKLKRILGEIRKVIPLGFNHHDKAQEWEGFNDAPDLMIIQQQLERARKQLGTLGGGNHFIEIQHGDDGHVWVMLHSGSRNFGLQVAGYYHKIALELYEKWYSNIPNKDLAFLPMSTWEGHDYLEAMNYCLRFAQASRALMMQRVLEVISPCRAIGGGGIDIHHNYAAMENHYGENVLVHRKGALKVALGAKGIIPGSMGSQSYIVEGLGNPESFNSCSHGAGRKMGRKEAKRTLSLSDEQGKMGSIVHGLRGDNDLDEAPGAYKDIEDVMANQEDLVKPVVTLYPVASIKG